MEGCKSLVGFGLLGGAKAARDEEEARGVSDACYLPRRGETTICTADNRGTNSTAPEYSAPAAHHPGACCPGGLSQVRACAKVLSAPRLRVRFRHGIRQRQGARAWVSRHRADVAGCCAQPSQRSARRSQSIQIHKYRAYWQAMQRRDALRWPAQTDR